jgi:hypothetical protein
MATTTDLEMTPEVHAISVLTLNYISGLIDHARYVERMQALLATDPYARHERSDRCD